jgi:hypothetical protein
MHAMRRDSSSPPRTDDRRPRTFLCRDDLYRAFEDRARELECSVDWLLTEAMKRLLASPSLTRHPSLVPYAPRPPLGPPAPLAPIGPLGPAAPLAPLGPPRAAPPPPPPRRPRATGSFVGPTDRVAEERLALRLGDARTVLDKPRVIIGRSARDAQLVVRDASVSRQHALIERAMEGWFVVDMGSTNGVLLNGSRVARARIRAGDVLVVGPVSIVVERA